MLIYIIIGKKKVDEILEREREMEEERKYQKHEPGKQNRGKTPASRATG